jgi:hypothetical protein
MFQSYQHRGEVFREAVQQITGAADKKDKASAPNAFVAH